MEPFGGTVLRLTRDHYKVTAKEWAGRGTLRTLPALRVATYILRTNGYSFPVIGCVLGRHHSTIIAHWQLVHQLPDEIAIARKIEVRARIKTWFRKTNEGREYLHLEAV